MGSSVEVAPPPAGKRRLPFGLPGLQGWALVLLVGWLYYPVLSYLVFQWSTDPNFQHGMFVPAFSLFVLWQDRQKLKSIESSPSWAGFPLIVMALLMLGIGVLGVELFTSRISLLVLLAGLIIQFRGKAFFRAVLFPWAFLILMIPLPELIQQRFTFPLQLLAAKLSTLMLQTVGVPVLREGNVIVLAAMPLDVVEACSGIRSLLTLVTLAVIYGYLLEKRIWVRVVLVCAAVPIAVLANGFRIFGTGLLVQYWDPDKAKGFFHEFQGWLVYVVALILFFTLHRLINLIWKPSPDGELAALHVAASHGAETIPGAGKQVSAPLWSPRFLIPALLMLVSAAVLQARSKDEVFPPRQPLSSLPAQLGSWTGTDIEIDQQTLDILGHGEFLQRDYIDASDPQNGADLFIAYFRSQKRGDTIHSPSHCLPGAGWVPTRRQIVFLDGPDGKFPVNRYVVSKGGERQLVLYWFQAHGREIAGEFSAKYYLIYDSIRQHRSDGSLVRLMTPMYRGESPDDGQARIMKLGGQVIPLLDQYIPR